MSDEEIFAMISDVVQAMDQVIWEEYIADTEDEETAALRESLVEIAREHIENAEG